MANPFQDQLLKAGLVSKKQAKKANREKYLNRKQKKQDNSSTVTDKARQEQAALAERNRQLNRQRAEKKQQRENQALIKQLIEGNRLKRDDRGEPYYFTEQTTINRIFVAEEMAEKLSRGQLAIVKLGSSYEVVPADVARRIANCCRETVIAFHQGGK